MRRVVLFKPDVSMPLHLYVLFLVGAIVLVGAFISFLARWLSLCDALPFISIGALLIAVFPWNLRHMESRHPRLRLRRTAVVLIAFAVLTAIEAIRCRL